ncbi:hypothetical protein [Nocardioides sp. Iso805N]|uniref:hypothetical protein n=1 Tax=Nocardioides sp. Iso805N TaxID=1283287 RepID=UPI00037C5D98|nr:hypothetical protein [Nocardioides sp. Iso805N]
MSRRREIRDELWLFLGYALVVFRPGTLPPTHPDPGVPPIAPPPSWTDDDVRVYLEEARRDLDQQRADKSDVRARAQLVFTTTLVLGTGIAAAYRHSDPTLVAKVIYAVSGLLTLLAGLAAAGAITAKSLVGAPNVAGLPNTAAGKVARRIAEEYAATRYFGAATVAVLVTVLRDCVLALVVAFAAFVIAYSLPDAGTDKAPDHHPITPQRDAAPTPRGSA